MAKVFSYDEVSKHNTAESCWVILYGHVYDVTSFLNEHPGGSKIILQLAGTDATEEYDPIHPPGILEETLPAEAKLGKFDESTLPKQEQAPAAQQQAAQSAAVGGNTATTEPEGPPDLESLLNLDDIEAAATKQISAKGWAYYYSASDDLFSKTYNNTAYRQILMRPRVFVDCTNCDTSTTLLGHNVNLPIYVSPAAMARLAHPDGEHGIAQACARFGALQVVSNNASMTPEQIVADAAPGQMFGWQLYVQTERRKSEAMLQRIAKLPQYKFICLTLDAPVPGKREHDERSKNVGSNLPVRSSVQEGSASTTSPAPQAASAGGESGGIGRSLFQGTAPDLTWKTTLPWLAKHTQLPIVLKGIQTHEDAYLASLYAPQVKGIILSNHGGRAMDTAPPAVHTLLEIRKYCPEVFDKIEVWVDGGIKRGTDVVKALCLGAKAVGVGRAALFGLGAGGKEGVARMLEILKAETETAMRLLGVEKVEDLGMQHINVRQVERDLYDGPANLQKPALWEKVKARL
ncbi:L-lactate dehydrogenase [Macrophomina phaseolina]|uniref:L-lactate dehydrogenase n=1 Tax=Macrophomina phaseolina TaxID=35725 RepID=A0ABQ8G735_9PEZI|nr:L-lactate dehydrogenase [Macrophomina phaseolina]